MFLSSPRKTRKTVSNTVGSEPWEVDEWSGCYPSNWKGLVVTEAMAHPAKFSSKLIRKIYSHMQEEGWVTEGDNVLDPFGGVALGALEAMRLGLNWYGVELEEKFHQKGKQGMLDGGVKTITTESKSFFRRLAEKKGSPRIDWEVVYCMEKTAPTPLSATQTSPQIGGRDLEGEIAEAVHG